MHLRRQSYLTRDEVFLKGAPFHPNDPDESSRQGVGVVFQELPLIPDLSVMENIYFNRQPLSPAGTVLRRRLQGKDRRTVLRPGPPGDRPHQACP